MRPASQNPYLFMTKMCDFLYSIHDLTLNKYPVLDRRVTSRCGTYTVAVNIICEGLLLLVLSSMRRGRGRQRADGRRGHDEEVASSKK